LTPLHFIWKEKGGPAILWSGEVELRGELVLVEGDAKGKTTAPYSREGRKDAYGGKLRGKSKKKRNNDTPPPSQGEEKTTFLCPGQEGGGRGRGTSLSPKVWSWEKEAEWGTSGEGEPFLDLGKVKESGLRGRSVSFEKGG